MTWLHEIAENSLSGVCLYRSSRLLLPSTPSTNHSSEEIELATATERGTGARVDCVGAIPSLFAFCFSLWSPRLACADVTCGGACLCAWYIRPPHLPPILPGPGSQEQIHRYSTLSICILVDGAHLRAQLETGSRCCSEFFVHGVETGGDIDGMDML